jgi:hypothetical protein
MSAIPPLSGDKQTFGERAKTDAIDPSETLATNLAVMHNAAFPATMW